MKPSKKIFIAQMLMDQNLITKAQLDQAIELQKKTDKKIGQILVEQGYIEENKLLHFLAEQFRVQYIDLMNYKLDHDIVKTLPEFYSRHLRAIVLKFEPNNALVGMVDPQDLLAIEEIERLLNKPITPALIREDDLLTVLDTIYRRADQITHFAETLSAELKPADTNNVFSETQDFSSEDLPVVNLLRSIFEDASQVNASDIHIEPDEHVLHIRLRIDGVLQEQIIEEKAIATALIQRVKLISGLNIAEKRLPQDGRFSIQVKNKAYDVRVSTIPVQYGESLVMRLLNQSSEVLTFTQIGMPEDVYEYFHKCLHASYGLVLIVGPTGSGKTTTLYAALAELNTPGDKIITVEDPVEYRLARINQVQVNPKIGLTFANVLRAILRQDPDIIMIGELRDQETMEIALRSAMTGHLVLSTLHTNDSISTATRLIDMGAEGYLVASVLRAVLSQRLVRRICPKCIIEDELDAAEMAWVKAHREVDFANAHFKRGRGCSYCHKTGYAGRICVFELLPITSVLADELRKGNTHEFIKLAPKQPLYKPLVETGLDLALAGTITVREVIAMVGEI